MLEDTIRPQEVIWQLEGQVLVTKTQGMSKCVGVVSGACIGTANRQ